MLLPPPPEILENDAYKFGLVMLWYAQSLKEVKRRRELGLTIYVRHKLVGAERAKRRAFLCAEAERKKREKEVKEAALLEEQNRRREARKRAHERMHPSTHE